MSILTEKTNSESIILAREVLKQVPDTVSPDVTLGLFETIARQPDLFIHYRALGANGIKTLLATNGQDS